MEQRFVVVDVETTGNSPTKGDKIIQLAAVVVENGNIIEKYSSFINPEQEIPLFIEQLTGISTEMVQDAPVFGEIAAKVKELLHNAYFVAHNVLFDLTFIQEELKNSGVEMFTGSKLDTVELARMLMPTYSSYKLNHLAKNLSLSHTRPHQADSDAQVTADLLMVLLTKLESLPTKTLTQIQYFSKNLLSDLDEILFTISQTKQQLIQEEDLHFDYYKQVAIKKKKDISHENQVAPYEFGSIKIKICNDMTSVIEQFENRTGQIEMMDLIEEALETNQHALIEAATGIGKTLAYLIPSAIHAVRSEKPIIISTYTLQLQQQIWEKDIPILQRLLPFQINTAIVKGRSNYISLPKFERTLNEKDHNYDSILTILQILVWLTETETGDMDELNLPSGGKLFWEKIKSSASWVKQEKNQDMNFDFYHRAQENAQEANLIITNHAVYFTDIFSDNHLLPKHDTVVMDEAHHLEPVASERLGVQLSYVKMLNYLTRLGTFDHHGSLSKASTIFEKHKVGLNESFYIINDRIQNLLLDNDDLFRLLRMYTIKKTKSEVSSRHRYRFDVEKEKGRTWNSIIELILRIRMGITDVLLQFEKQKELVAPAVSQLSETERNDLSDYFSYEIIFGKIKEDQHQLFFQKDNQLITWIEADEKGAQNAAYIKSQFVDISELLANKFFSKKKSVILTSATLAAEGTFTYIIQQLGLEYFYPICATIPSPFLYKEQVKLMVPTDLPAVNQVPMEDYVQSISAHLIKIAKHFQGRMLVLFTSFEMLKATYFELKAHTELEEFILIGQGISGGSRSKLTKSFQAFQKSILLGMNSFWEGIDLPGDDLTCLVIIRLPFASPEDPIVEAKHQRIALNGGDSFNDLSLPQAVLRFKQGFGRLIRSKNDKGVIFVFDKRIVTKRYGKKFIQSLPEIDVHKEPLTDFLQTLHEWL